MGGFCICIYWWVKGIYNLSLKIAPLRFFGLKFKICGCEVKWLKWFNILWRAILLLRCVEGNKGAKGHRRRSEIGGSSTVGKLFANGIFWNGSCLGVEVRTGSICCDVWVVLGLSLDVSRMFPKFVSGSFVESFSVSPSDELLGLGEYPLFHIKTGVG